jgi:hypothetical protein
VASRCPIDWLWRLPSGFLPRWAQGALGSEARRSGAWSGQLFDLLRLVSTAQTLPWEFPPFEPGLFVILMNYEQYESGKLRVSQTVAAHCEKLEPLEKRAQRLRERLPRGGDRSTSESRRPAAGRRVRVGPGPASRTAKQVRRKSRRHPSAASSSRMSMVEQLASDDVLDNACEWLCRS